MKISLSNSKKRFSLLVSLVLMIIFSSVLFFSLFLSDTTLEKIAKSHYLQSKITQVLEDNAISSEGIRSIEFNELSSADINIVKAKITGLNDVVGFDINLKVDFIKYWFGLSFIEEVVISKVTYSSQNNFKPDLANISSFRFKFLTQSLNDFLNNTNAKSIYITSGDIEFKGQIFDFSDIKIAKNGDLLTAESLLSIQQSAGGTTLSAIVNLSLNEGGIITFNFDVEDIQYNNFLYLVEAPKMVRSYLGRLVDNATITEEERKKIKFTGSYDLNSMTLILGLNSMSDKFEFVSKIDVMDSLKKNSLMFGKTKLVLGEYSLSVSGGYFNFTNRTFETNVSKFSMPNKNFAGFPNKFKILGAFPIEGGVISKVDIFEEKPSNLKVSLEVLEPTDRSDKEDVSLDFFVHVDALPKINIDQIRSLFSVFSKEEKKEITLSRAKAEFNLKFKDSFIGINSFKGNINKLTYFENNKPLVELEDITLKGNLEEGYAEVNSLTKLEPSLDIYRDIKLEYSSTNNIEPGRELYLSFKSTISDFISLAPMPKDNLNWMNFLERSQGEKEISITYSSTIALNKIGNFFLPKENILELDVNNLSIPIGPKNSINLRTLNLKVLGPSIFFEGVMVDNNKKISGSIKNLSYNIFNYDRARDLTIFLDDFDSEILVPDLKAFSVKGPLKFNIFPVNDNSMFQCNIDLIQANVYIPALTLKKTKGNYGQLKLNFTEDNSIDFKYTQNDVLVSGSASLKSSFEIKKINYSSINTPDIQIKRATFQKFGKYDQFKTNRGTISLEFLMRLRLRKKDIPLDFIFSNINVTYKKNEFLDSMTGEIRSFEGLRGYAKAKFSPKSNLQVTISPNKNDAINLVISGNDAGELLRRGKFYENGYGGLFKASIFYQNKTKMSGSLEIENFRIKNAPVLAQIISSASIIGLLDNLNGNGLLFTKIDGSFDYKEGKLTLEDGVAVGPSLGITMSGYEKYGQKQNIVNVNGLLSPVYIINGVIKAIPLIGKVLGGEKGEGVFGVSYKVQGNSSNPIVLVNPLSILTPGVFRKIFNIEEKGNR